MKIIMTVAADQQAIAMGIGAEYKIQPIPEYAGPVTVTPSPVSQVLNTTGKAMTHDITVNPIPNNYGLITWNGSVLTVS